MIPTILISLLLKPVLGVLCEGFRKDVCKNPVHACETGPLEECLCAEGYWPQVDGLTAQGVRFGCCPGRGVTACGPQRQPIATVAQILLASSLVWMLLTTLAIHYKQPQPWRMHRGDSAVESMQSVDGARMHREIPMERWCVSLQDIKQFRRLVGKAVTDGHIRPTETDPFDPQDFSIGPSMYTVTEQYIKPITAAAGNASWALMKNRQGIACDVFITHAWAEGIFEFVDKVIASWPRGGKAAYVCFLSNPQNLDISDLISQPEESPFAKALSACSHVLAVPNRSCSIYSRLWCVYEAFLAYSWNKPITMAKSHEFNFWIYVLRMFSINSASLSLGLLLPLRLARALVLPANALVFPFLLIFLLSFGGDRYKLVLGHVGVLGVTITANVSYACLISTGHAFSEENWLFAVEYILLGLLTTMAMEMDRLTSLSALRSAKDLRRGFTGHLVDASCSREEDGRKILEQVRRSGRETDVEAAVDVLMKMNISTPELRATAERTGRLTDASHWSRAILCATFIAFFGFTPFTLLTYGHWVLGVEFGSWFQWLLVVVSALEAVVFFVLFMVLPSDRKAFAARVQSLWLPIWPLRVFGYGMNPWYYTVTVTLYAPLLLTISIMGPAKTAQIPFLGPGLVRLVFARPGCLSRLRQLLWRSQRCKSP